jgi:hypothetical protein
LKKKLLSIVRYPPHNHTTDLQVLQLHQQYQGATEDACRRGKKGTHLYIIIIMVQNMKDPKTNAMFAVLVATLVLALVSISYTESVSAHHKDDHSNGCDPNTNPGGCADDGPDDGPGLDVDPDDNEPGKGECC